MALLLSVAATEGRGAEFEEPSYGGRPLSAWLDALPADQDPADDNRAVHAVREIGSAAVPFLLAELRTLQAPALEAPDAHAANAARMVRAFQVLRLIGKPACTPASVATLADLSVGTDRFLAREALETLAAWGPSASYAVPPILNCFNAQVAAGGPTMSANQPPPPPFARTLARIGPDSKEVLWALLADRTFGRFSLGDWCDNSTLGIQLVREAASDPGVPTLSRRTAIGFLDSRRDTSLLAVLPKLLEEPALREPLLRYVERQGTNAASAWPVLLGAGSRFVRDDPQFADRAFQVVAQCGRSTADTLLPELLRMTFDERFPINSAIPVDEPMPLCIAARSALEVLVGSRDKLAPILTQYLHHTDWRLRNAAAARLWGTGPLAKETVGELKTCLSDTNEVVRLSAAVTLAHRPEFRQSVLDELIAAIRSETMPADLRIHALYQLQQRRPDDAECLRAIPVVQRAQEDSNPNVGQAAARVLASLQPPPE